MTSGRTHTPWWERDTTPGYLLLAATITSFLLLNGPLGEGFHHLLQDQIAGLAVGLGAGRHPVNLHLVINDGLMVIFFLFVGLELKRETIEGPFKNPREAGLPLAGAVGGMAAPALIYLAIAGHDPDYSRGWAIPAATDIAFAVGVLSLLGSRVPAGLRLFLLALAIIDDLGAIVVIALFYSSHLVGWALGGAVVTFVAMLLLNRSGVTALWLYWLLGLALWGFMLLSGVHATIAGVLTALAIPMRAKDGRSPLIAAEHALKPWVQLGIMPIFALANAGVVLAGAGFDAVLHPVALGAALGLILGKPIGITLATLAAGALLRQRLPASLPQFVGLACVAGIGFTMSLFIGNLAFGAGELATPVRFGVLGGSLISALLGVALLTLTTNAGHRGHAALERDEDAAEAAGVIEAVEPPPPAPKR
ncbi:Na+/H+ antiporter NhaA type [alpha proteobacterium U9-1i]|nr:Na+/H+ antiporter NhaA type [alpha proteobacterium U9-1i]